MLMGISALPPAAYEQIWHSALSMEEYRNGFEALNNSISSGTEKDYPHGEYVKINLQRSKRLEKLYPAVFQKQPAPARWLVITEYWCGDSAQVLPVMHAVACKNGIEMKLVFRDQHPELMDAHLTNGARSIPKLLILDQEFRFTGSWGPRPVPADELVREARQRDEHYEVYSAKLHQWYAYDKGYTITKELESLI